MALRELAEGTRLVGLNQVKRGIFKNKVQKVFLAEDADLKILRDMQNLAKSSGVPVEMVSSALILGRACAIDRCTATAALQR